MASTGATIYIDRSPKDVFTYLIELNDAQWRSGGLLEMRLLSQSYAGVGARHCEVRRMLGRRIETIAEAVMYEPNKRWAVRRASGRVRPQVTYTLDPEGEGTRLRFEFDVPVLHGIARLLSPLVPRGAHMVERATIKDLERLKERLEATSASTG
jgi:hypothetical protein